MNRQQMVIKLINVGTAFLFMLFGYHGAFAQDNQKVRLANEYYIQGDAVKAMELYEELSKDDNAIPLIHTNYLSLMIDTEDYKGASKYLKQLIKSNPTNLYYKIDYGLLFFEQGLMKEAEAQFMQVIQSAKDDQYQLRISAQYFISKQLYKYAEATFLAARAISNQSIAFSLELANVYRMMNKKEAMLEEYLNFAGGNPNNLNYTKNLLQNLLTEDGDLEMLEEVLIAKVQNRANEPIYSELLIWVNLQRRNFYGAFLQARALEKRTKGDGSKLLDIGNIALENKSYDNAIKIFEYITIEFTESRYYIPARKLLINAREGMVKNTFPINYDEIRILANAYQQLLDDIGINHTTLEALRNKAQLHAFYLDEKEIAIGILQQIINTPRVNKDLQANCKIDLGDIYLLIGEPWESTLLYSQVEKANKESIIGYNAKLKNAKLNYYKGNFELAKGHLDILKLATTREISNDAIALSMLIQDNTAIDTSDLVMKEYASIELLLFQNKYTDAVAGFYDMLEKYPQHSLTDEVWFNLANIYKTMGEFEKAIQYLERIVETYDYDILSDDAFFLMATIFDYHIGDKEKAKELYQEMMRKYPGSKFVAEARMRFRKLRGDLIN